MTNTIQTEEAAARWLMRREETDWSAEDQAELDAWLDADAEHKVAYWRLEYGWRKVERAAALRSPPVAGHRGRQSLRRAWRRIALAVASTAAVALCVFAVSTADFWKRKTYATDIGVHRTVVLSDGSKIELNTATAVQALIGANARDVWLDRGEAYFEVAHDPAKPFVVHAGGSTATALGTQFSVRRDDDRVRLSMVDGRVRMESGNALATPVVAVAGDVVVVQGTSSVVTHKPVEQIDADLSWRQGMLRFDQLSLADAAAEFNRYNRKQLVIADARVAQMRIGGTFESSNLDAFVRLLHQAYGLKVDEANGVVKISE